MTDIEQKALALVNEVFTEKGGSPIDCAALVGAGDVVTLALCRAIEQHEAFKQEVSDAVEAYLNPNNRIYSHSLNRFIIPKSDPLVDVMKDLSWDEETACEEWAADLRAALEARGLEIREKGQ